MQVVNVDAVASVGQVLGLVARPQSLVGDGPYPLGSRRQWFHVHGRRAVLLRWAHEKKSSKPRLTTVTNTLLEKHEEKRRMKNKRKLLRRNNQYLLINKT